MKTTKMVRLSDGFVDLSSAVIRYYHSPAKLSQTRLGVTIITNLASDWSIKN